MFNKKSRLCKNIDRAKREMERCNNPERIIELENIITQNESDLQECLIENGLMIFA